METLLLYAILFCADIITAEIYQKKLDALFLENPNHEILLELEWETDINQAMHYIHMHMDDAAINQETFGLALMEKLQEYYESCSDIKYFANKMYSLWQSLPCCLQYEEPFWTLSYADDPLSWGDEAQTRTLYEKMLHSYHNAICHD